MAGLVDVYGAPLAASGRMPTPSRDAGAYRGAISGWHGPQIHTAQGESRERQITQRRTSDLFVNDWAAGSGIDSIASNAIGTGLMPQVNPPAEMLGITREQARATARIMAWLWSQWSQEAHHAGQMHFEDLQFLGIRTMLRAGELLHIPVMVPEEERIEQGRIFSLAIQNLNPSRLATPADKTTDSAIHDGVELSPSGRPLAYHIAVPSNAAGGGVALATASPPMSSSFCRIPARIGHRPGVFHLFRADMDEQVRGVSPLARGVKLFRHLTDALDYELFAQVIAAAFPVYFSQEAPGQLPINGMPGAFPQAEQPDAERIPHANIAPGSMLYGPTGEKPYILESKRPSQNFATFVEIIQRAQAACLGITYESLSKDYSKTNYSSARAAINEAWKLYMFYRKWFARMYCQPIFEMVMEEAYLRGLLVLPKGAPGFYEARRFWCCAEWVGPARGFVDPVKEITAIVMALKNRLMTYGEAWMERGGDFDDALEIMMDEAARMEQLPPSQADDTVPAPPKKGQEEGTNVAA